MVPLHGRSARSLKRSATLSTAMSPSTFSVGWSLFFFKKKKKQPIHDRTSRCCVGLGFFCLVLSCSGPTTQPRAQPNSKKAFATLFFSNVNDGVRNFGFGHLCCLKKRTLGASAFAFFFSPWWWWWSSLRARGRTRRESSPSFRAHSPFLCRWALVPQKKPRKSGGRTTIGQEKKREKQVMRRCAEG